MDQLHAYFDFGTDMLLLLAASCFIVGLKDMSSPKTARRGNLIAAGGMVLGTLVILVDPRVFNVWPALHGTPDWTRYGYIAVFAAVGAIIGWIAAKKVEMTAMPQMVAILNGLGGAASMAVASAEFFKYMWVKLPPPMFSVAGGLSIVIGGVTVTGSFIAFAKLQELMTTSSITLPGHNIITAIASAALIGAFGVFVYNQGFNPYIFFGIAVGSLVLGILLVIPIGGADMPVVISLLNSYSGLAAAAAGFVVGSNVLIVSGCLVGASGLILTRIMCTAMNRSLANVIFGAFGSASKSQAASSGDEKPMKEFMPMDAAMLLTNARNVIVVPGYGLAVSQAQSNVRELADELESEGVEVRYAIHPVAGRMPGHMNVLLAEANIDYEKLCDIDDINGDFESADVCVVIGANDVTNPDARDDKQSPLYGMPILNCDKSQTVIVLKRGRGKGFAGVVNPLFTADNTGLVFGDAKKSLVNILNEVKELNA